MLQLPRRSNWWWLSAGCIWFGLVLLAFTYMIRSDMILTGTPLLGVANAVTANIANDESAQFQPRRGVRPLDATEEPTFPSALPPPGTATLPMPRPPATTQLRHRLATDVPCVGSRR